MCTLMLPLQLAGQQRLQHLSDSRSLAACRLDVGARVGEKCIKGFLGTTESVPGLFAIANPRRIKAAHRRRRKIASGQSVQRYYDPGIERFLSVDPVTADGGDMRHFNRYAYAYNNPYRFTDPDGRVNWEKLADSFKAEVGFTLGLKAKASIGPVKVDVGVGEMSYGGGATPVDAYGFAEVSGPSMSAEAGNLEVGYKGSSERSEMGRDGVSYQEKKSGGKWVAGFKKAEAEVGEYGDSAEIGASVSAVLVRATVSVDLGQIVDAIADKPPPPPKEEQIQ